MNNSEWFLNWFNSPYYYILYKHRDNLEAKLLIDNLLKYFAPQKNSLFLDLACGKGRHSIYLNSKGYQVVGVDISAASIQYAQSFKNSTLDFFIHDMRIPYHHNYFDFVFNLFTSFGYFSEKGNKQVIDAQHKNLKKGGFMVLDFMNINVALKKLTPEEIITVDGINFKISKKHEDNFIKKEINFTDENKNYTFLEKVAAISYQELTGYFETDQWKIKEIFGCYNLLPFDIESSNRLIIIAEKI
jgi:SAM-dependent methyltransferase